VVDAATLTGVPLTIVGTGPDESRLRARAGATVTFRGAVDGAELRELYRRSRAVLMPGEEDFGIAPVEAMACGRPVIALGRGGAIETVVPGVTGVLVDPSNIDGPQGFADAMQHFDPAAYDPKAIRAHAEQFGIDRFEQSFRAAVNDLIATAAC
jgi:glycosyltransferase involved in cell wall biosynthesis